MILTAKHPEITGERSYLSAPVATGAVSTTLKSITNINANDYVVYGKPGEEKTEIVKITSVTPSTKVVGHAATVFAHEVSTPIQVIKYNKVRFYKSATLTGTYTLLVGGELDIDIDDTDTRFDYLSGLASDYFKVAYYNTTTSTESQLSEPLIGSGYTRNALYSLIKETRMYVGDQPTDDEIIMALNSAQDAVFGKKDKWYFAKTSAQYSTTKTVTSIARVTNVCTLTTSSAHGFVTGDLVQIYGTTPVGATTFDGTFTIASTPSTTTFTYSDTAADDTATGGACGTYRFDLPVDFLTLDRLEFRYNDGTNVTTTDLEYYDHAKFIENNSTEPTPADQAVSFTIDEAGDQILLSPSPAAITNQTFKLYYWKRPTALAEYTDETDVPNPAVIVFWSASKIEASKQNGEKSRVYWQEYTQQLESMTNRRVGKVKNLSVV